MFGWFTAIVGGGVEGGLSALGGAFVGGAVGGWLLSKVGGAALGGIARVATNAAVGTVSGAFSGAVSGGISYGAGCAMGRSCTGSGFTGAVGNGAVLGGVFGGIAGGTSRPSSVSCHSFDPNTPVLMADGSARPIKDVAVGDKVTSTDPTTGITTAQPVTRLHLNKDTDLTDLTVTSAPDRQPTDPHYQDAHVVRRPTAAIHTTTHHPFWDATTKRWVDAGSLQPGHQLVGPQGQVQYVAQVHNYTDAKFMHDLTVANIHTYYVMAGNTPVLVHNCGGALTVNKYAPENPGESPHFSVEVSDGINPPSHTEQVITAADHSSTRIVPFMSGMQLVDSVTIRVPNAAAAIAEQQRLIGIADTGPYSIISNSCLSHCMDVARAGGIEVSGVRDFASSLGWSVRDLLS
jgi:hypothetical protein